MRAIDTNILVRMATRDDEKQARAADACIAMGVWVSHAVIAETAWVLTALYGASRPSLTDTIGKLLDHVSITVQDADVVRAALGHFRQDNTISFPDCLILEVARKAGHLPLVTFDRDFAKLDDVERLGAKT